MLLHIVPWANNLGAFINSFLRSICLESYYHRSCICLRDHKDVADFFFLSSILDKFLRQEFRDQQARQLYVQFSEYLSQMDHLIKYS